MLFNELAEKFNNTSKELGVYINDKKFDEALEHLTKFEEEVKPYLISCEMTCEDFAEREQFNIKLRIDCMNWYQNCETINEKKTSAEGYNMATRELYELWTSWKAIIKQFENTLENWRSGILRAKQQHEAENKKS